MFHVKNAAGCKDVRRYLSLFQDQIHIDKARCQVFITVPMVSLHKGSINEGLKNSRIMQVEKLLHHARMIISLTRAPQTRRKNLANGFKSRNVPALNMLNNLFGDREYQ
uniref:Uncharacterized protein n=1 Tax=Solanum lycopersicum TaxID=4081 RepID=A0A3Q7ENK9_SOLLC